MSADAPVPGPFSVWAPRPQRVRLSLDETVHPMRRDPDGWWYPVTSLEVPGEAVEGGRYGFLLDDDDRVLPDPRSRWLPDGVHGTSAVFDPGQFRWSDADWAGRDLAGGVIYELHIGTFTPGGTLDDAVGRLPHLVELGIDFVELLPVNAFNGSHNWGYDGVAWFAVDRSYGGPAAYQRFVDACHTHGLAVVQDVVYNHLGPSGNYLPAFGPYLHHDRGNTWGDALALDELEVRRFILDNTAMWFRDMHVDALRLDAVHALVDVGPIHLLAELAERTAALGAALGRPLTLIAESDLNDPTMITPVAEGGLGMDAQWSDDFHHAVHVRLTGETTGYYADFADPGALEKVMIDGFFHDGTWSSFRGRDHGRQIDTNNVEAWRLVVCSQNHDQIGNRAAGDRLSSMVGHEQLAIAAVLTLAGAFTPMLFMGEEWGATTSWQFFTAHPEPELGRATAEGRIDEFARMGWDRSQVPDPQAESTFTDSKLRWAELDEPSHRKLFELYRRLISARRTHPALRDPAFPTSTHMRNDELLVVDRGGRSAVVVNFSHDRQTVDARGEIVVTTVPDATSDGSTLELAGQSAVVLVT